MGSTNKTVCVYKKELKSYFNNALGYVLIAVILAAVTFYFRGMNLEAKYADISLALQNCIYIFLLFLPVLTMRVLVEERRQKTDQLLLTSPVSVWSIVVGKYLAALTIYLLPVLVIGTYPLLLTRYGTVNLPGSYNSILAFFLLGAVCIAIGTFVSSLTESQIVAALVTFGALLISFMSQNIIAIIPTSANTTFVTLFVALVLFGLLLYNMTKSMTLSVAVAAAGIVILTAVKLLVPAILEGGIGKILGGLALFNHFGAFIGGTFDVGGLVYFLSAIFLFLFFTKLSIEKRRWS